MIPRACAMLSSFPQDPHRWLDDFFEACDTIPGGCGITHLAIHSYSCEVRVLWVSGRAVAAAAAAACERVRAVLYQAVPRFLLRGF